MSTNTHSTDLELSSNQYWSITDGSQSGLDITGNLTISFWFKKESAMGSDETRGLVSKSVVSGDNLAYRLILNTTSGTERIRFGVSNAGTVASFVQVNWNFSFTVGVWYNLIVIYTASTGEAELFVNNSSQGTQSGLPTSIFNSAASFFIGTTEGSGNYWDGLINDVRVWARLLSDTEIGDLYADGCTFDNGASLVGWWFINEDGNDDSGNSNNLTNNNSATFSTDVGYVCGGAASVNFLTLLGIG